MSEEKKSYDWAQIELDYRAGIKSLRQIASEQGCSDTAIRKKAKREEWTRDLKAKIQAKADELVRNEVVRTSVRIDSTKPLNATEKQTVEANANHVAAIRISHRKDIAHAKTLCMRLFDELAEMIGTEQIGLLQDLGEMMRKENDKGVDKLNDLYHKVIDMPNRVNSMRGLSSSLETLIKLEVDANGLNQKEETVDALGQLLNKITQGNTSAFTPVEEDQDYNKDDART